MREMDGPAAFALTFTFTFAFAVVDVAFVTALGFDEPVLLVSAEDDAVADDAADKEEGMRCANPSV